MHGPFYKSLHLLGNMCLFNVRNRNTRKRCEIYSKLTIKAVHQRQWRRSGTFIVNFSSISIVNFEQVNVSWAVIIIIITFIAIVLLNKKLKKTGFLYFYIYLHLVYWKKTRIKKEIVTARCVRKEASKYVIFRWRK